MSRAYPAADSARLAAFSYRFSALVRNCTRASCSARRAASSCFFALEIFFPADHRGMLTPTDTPRKPSPGTTSDLYPTDRLGKASLRLSLSCFSELLVEVRTYSSALLFPEACSSHCPKLPGSSTVSCSQAVISISSPPLRFFSSASRPSRSTSHSLNVPSASASPTAALR